MSSPNHPAKPTKPQRRNDMPKKKITIDELEKMLNSDDSEPLTILPNGEVRVLKGKARREALKNKPKILTMRETLGGEYAGATA